MEGRLEAIRARFALSGKARKCEISGCLPGGYDSLLLIDADARILGDITLGFEKAEAFGIAAAQAPHYSLESFQNFHTVMKSEGVRIWHSFHPAPDDLNELPHVFPRRYENGGIVPVKIRKP